MTASQPGAAERRVRVEALFEAALDLPPDGRDAFLAERCAGDDALAGDVRRLLRAHDRADGLLDDDAPASAAGLLDTGVWGAGRSRTEERIGPYRIRDELGRGGTGVVYLAERDDGQFRRRVAIKVIQAGHDPELRARVLAERQILASLEHPNIAQLLDAGITDDGRFYLVMEHVAGLPLDLYCDRMRLSVRERLDLFVTVAEVVEHAHRNLVVHRDLKPSNILVTPEGRVKLLDFGIAKLLNPGLAGVDAPVTRRGSLVLTPAYASPEQLRGESLTTATDVYSLGVILYRLLCGHAPYETGGRSAAAVLAAMSEKDPPRPSQRAGLPRREEAPDGSERTVSAEEIAADRRSTTGRLPRTLRGDLDAIVMKALRKEPTRRYGSAESLAEDIQRHLKRQPVTAHRDSRGYRLTKLVRRHKGESVAALVVLLSLVAGVAATGWQARVAGRERDRAAEALLQAEGALAQSEEVSDFLMELFQAGDPLAAGSEEVTARDLVRRGLSRADELADQPVVQARMLGVLGEIQRHFGATDEAVGLLERSVALRRAELGPDHPDLATGLLELARARRDLGRPREARAAVEEALDIRARLWGDPHPAVAEAYFELGWLAQGAEQERLYREALRLHREAGAEPGTEGAMLEALATNLRRQGRLEDALATAREALAVREAAFGPDDARTAVALYHVADHVRDVEGDYEEAEHLYRRGIAAHTRAYGEFSLRLIHGYTALATLEARRGRHQESEALFRRALAIREAATSPDNPALARSMGPVAMALARQGRLDEAEALLLDALAHVERTLGPDHVARYAGLADLGEVRALQGRWDEAADAFQGSFALRLRAGGPDDIVLGEMRRRWGRILTGGGRFAEAEAHLRAALEGLDRVYGPEHPNHVDARRALHELYTAWGRPAEAARYQVPPGAFHPY